jgi:hypothetical protein
VDAKGKVHTYTIFDNLETIRQICKSTTNHAYAPNAALQTDSAVIETGQRLLERAEIFAALPEADRAAYVRKLAQTSANGCTRRRPEQQLTVADESIAVTRRHSDCAEVPQREGYADYRVVRELEDQFLFPKPADESPSEFEQLCNLLGEQDAHWLWNFEADKILYSQRDPERPVHDATDRMRAARLRARLKKSGSLALLPSIP